CRSWQASLSDKRIKLPICLTLTEGYYHDEHCFYSKSEATFDVLNLPEIQGNRCWGSPFCWLVTCAFDFEISLFNPFSRTRIFLSSLNTIPEVEDWPSKDLFDYSIRKLILCTSPEESDCIVFAIISAGSFFAKPSDEAWTLICHSDRYYLDDAIYFKGNFYGCLHTGEIVLCEATPPKVVELAPPPRVFGFDIFKLDIDTKTWEKVYSLGDRSLFLGNCSTFAIAAADYPSCKPNCIYYSVDGPLLAATLT
ncbi:hypothetical protein Godav_029526, partial [Gossypium davidsonii]|nr:hypothetical protein [Gossypium davidsonii]MBA0665511.1 hypothetical protein [Gossypium klotzschianum]